MNENLVEIYRSCRSKEALASQDEYKSANALLGSEVEKFAELLIRKCHEQVTQNPNIGTSLAGARMAEYFGVKV